MKISPKTEPLASIVEEAMGDPFEEHFLTEEQIAAELKRARSQYFQCPADGGDPEALADWLEELGICN